MYIKSVCGIENYMTLLGFKETRNIIQIRTDNHKLPVETGRYRKIPIEDRKYRTVSGTNTLRHRTPHI